MSSKNGFHICLVVLILGVLLVVSINPQVSAQLGGDGERLEGEITGDGVVDGGPGFIMVSAFDFKPVSSLGVWNYSGANLSNPSMTTTYYYVAGVSLPHGANLTRLTLYYLDASTSNINAEFYRVFGDGTMTTITSFSTSENYLTPRYQSIDIPAVTIDNQSYSYFVMLTLPPAASTTIQVVSVRIDYAYINSVPLVMK